MYICIYGGEQKLFLFYQNFGIFTEGGGARVGGDKKLQKLKHKNSVHSLQYSLFKLCIKNTKNMKEHINTYEGMLELNRKLYKQV